MSDTPEPNPEAIPAVARCCQAMQAAYQAIRSTYEANGKESDEECQDRAAVAAQRAYCQAMPPLSGCENIRDFIACVAHGMLLDVFTGAESTRLLYAAQVANTAARGHAATIPAALSRAGRVPPPPPRCSIFGANRAPRASCVRASGTN